MQFTIFGLGQFGTSLACQLANVGHEVTVVDNNRDNIDKIKDKVMLALCADARKQEVLNQLDLSEDMYFVVAIGEDFEASLMITATLKDLGAKNIYSRAVNETQQKLLKLLDIKKTIGVEDLAANQLKKQFENKKAERYIEIDNTHGMGEYPVPLSWINKQLKEVELRSEFELNLLTIRENVNGVNSSDAFASSDLPVIDSPLPSRLFKEGDMLLLFGKEENLKRFSEELEEMK